MLRQVTSFSSTSKYQPICQGSPTPQELERLRLFDIKAPLPPDIIIETGKRPKQKTRGFSKQGGGASRKNTHPLYRLFITQLARMSINARRGSKGYRCIVKSTI